MTTAVKLLSKLGAAGINLWLDETLQLRFRAPKGAMTAEFKQAIGENKADIIAFLQQAQLHTETIQPIERQADGLYALSYAQQRFWFLDNLQPGNPSLNIPAVLSLDGALNSQALEQAFNQLSARHESLRTIFVCDNNLEAKQYVLDQLHYRIACDDLSGLDSKAQDAQVNEQIRQHATHPFTLASSRENPQPLLHSKLLKLGEKQHYLLLNLHHIIADGWSIRLLIQELSQYYQAIVEEKHAQLPPLAVHYIDYCHYQQQQAQSTTIKKQLAYWQHKLSDIAILDLPLDFPRPRQSSPKGDSVTLTIEQGHVEAVRKLAAQCNTSSFNVFLTAFAVLLYRYTGQDDIAIGTPVAGRHLQELEPIIGCFINLLTIRNSVDSQQSFSDFTRQVANTVLEAQEHQQIPFEQVAEHCVSQRSTAYTPLFQVLFTHQQDLLKQFSLADLDIAFCDMPSYSAKYDMQLHIDEQQNHSQLMIEYNSDLFFKSSIEAFAEHYTKLLESITANAEQSLAQLNIFSAEDTAKLLPETTITAPAHSLDALLSRGQTAAVIHGQSQIDYPSLQSKVHNLAAYLQQQGIQAGDRVGIFLPYGIDQISAVLACIQCHACYVPMDTRYPADRLQHMVDNADMAMIISQQSLEEKLNTPVPFLALESLAECTTSFTPPATNDDALLYLIYTSGSTGLPKGAGVSRANEVNLLQWYVQHYQFSADDKFLVFSALGFDLTQKNLLAPFVCGAQLVFPESPIYDPEYLLQLIQQQQITVINCAPSAFYPLVELAEASQRLHFLSSLRHVLFGGEPIILENLQPWLKREDCQVQLGNMYGPTECTDISNVWPIDKNHPLSQAIPIGETIDGVYNYVLDKDMNPVPLSANGELFIAGNSVGTGYFNQPSEQQASFIDNPFGQGKLYRTGDRVCYLRQYWPQPVLEFIERVDEQVKIRGFRIELEEIANRLMQIDGIREAKVFADSAQQHLIAYYIASAETLEAAALREQLQNQLPDYMLPSAFIAVDAWPLSANGKIDRKRLPQVGPEHSVQGQFIAPHTLLQQQLCTLWQDLLNISSVGMSDNFFELGGHSLTATRLIARINQDYHCSLSLADFFATPTVQALAQQIEQGDAIENTQALLSVKADRSQAIPLSYAQKRLWIMEQINPGSSVYNIPFALKLEGELHKDALLAAIKQIIQRHESLRTQIISDNQLEPSQVILPVDACPIEQASSDAKNNSELEALFTEFANQPFDLAKDCLTRIRLVQLGNNTHLLMVCMHHIISDGWSLSVLQKELAHFYNAAVQGETSNTLAALPLQYADFSVWQQDYLAQEKQQQHLQYWLEQLSDIPAAIQLPFDRPRPAQQTFAGGMVRMPVPEKLNAQLVQFSQQQGLSLFTTLLSLYSLLLNKYAQQGTICIGTPVSGREISELQQLIGYFVNAVVIRSDLSANPSFAQLLERTQSTVLQAFAHQDIPVEQVLEQLPLERNASYPPVAQVGFSFIGKDLAQMPALDGLELSLIDYQQTVAKYELTLIVIESDKGLELNLEYNSDLFDHSTIEQFAQHFIHLSEQALTHQQQGISSLSLLSDDDIARLVDIDPAQLEAVHPLSAMQKDMVLSQWIQTQSLANTLGYRAELNTWVDADLWQQACQLTSDMEPVTRSVFVINPLPYGELAWQCVLKKQPVQLEVMDYRQENLSEESINQKVHAFIYQPEAYQQGVFIRYGLMRISDSRTLLLLSAHHALLDGVAIVLIAQQTAKHYDLLDQKKAIALAPSALLQADYAENDKQQRDNNAAQAFWQETFSQCEALDFPASLCSKEAKQIVRTHALSPALSQSLRTYCRSQRMTVAQLFKLVYGVLISNYCRADNNFYFSEFNAGRNRENAQALGCFFEQSPFIFPATQLTLESTIQDLFAYLRQFRKDIKAFDNLSLGATHKLAPTGRLHFMYNFYHFFPQHEEMLGHAIECIEMPPFIDKTVQFIAKEHEQHISLDLYYQSDVFADNDFLARFASILQQLVDGQDTLADLSLLLEGEQPLVGDTVALPEGIHSVQQLFDLQVDKTPNATALIDAQGRLSYKELNQASNRLAHYLQQQGVTKGTRVGVYLARNRDAIIAIMAVIKAGGCYVPIDTHYPQQRISHMLEEAAIRHIISEQCHLDALEYPVQNVIALDKLAPTLQQCSVANPEHTTQLIDPLYVIFTSGSTGLPKGAELTHQGEINLLQWYCRQHQFNQDSCTFIISALGFDLSQKNLFAPLVSGGRLLLDELPHYDIEHIQQLIEEHQVSHINCAPSAFYPLIEQHSEKLHSLRQVMLGGESLQGQLLSPWLQSTHCNAQLSNHYGPTECTDIALFHTLQSKQLLQLDSIPLGKPNDNVSVMIMNRFQQILPEGLMGEICIAGVGVGLGYINQAAANEESFIQAKQLNQRIYRSGDLGWQANGLMHFGGRADFQVKIHGLRIELGEIEQALKQLTAVNDALVLVEKDQLIAYLLSSEAIDTDAAKQQLAKQLPHYMLPQHFVVLNKWPLSANGKVDRKALPLPDPRSNAVEYVAPRDDIEQAICDIVRRVLNIDKVGVHDNFFDIGGHSLAASRAIVQIREQFSIDIPLNVLFDMTTVEKLASYIKAAQWAIQSSEQHEDDQNRDTGFI